MEYDEVCLNYFLEHQSQLFDENVADSLEEAEAFLEDCMAVICDNIKEAEEVFSLPDGRYLVVEA